MADRIWTGAVDGDWNNTGNWSGGQLPADGDDVIVQAGAGAMTTNLDRSGGSGLRLNLFVTDPGFTNNIGASGSPLTLNADRVVHRGTGTFWFRDKAGTDLFTTQEIVVDSDATGEAMHVDGDNVERLLILKGNVTVESSAAPIGLVEVSYRSVPQTDARLTVNSGAGVIETMFVMGGLTTCNARVRTMVASGGVVTQDVAPIETLVLSGATVIYNTPRGSSDDGAIVTAHLMRGTLDFTRTGVKKLIRSLFLWPGATFQRNASLTTITDKKFMGDTTE